MARLLCADGTFTTVNGGWLKTYGGTGSDQANGLLVDYMDSSVFVIGTSASIS